MASSKDQPSKTNLAVVPHLTVHDCAAAIDFYKRAFGAVEVARHAAPDSKKIMHASVTILGAPLMLNDDFPEFCGGKSRTPRALGGSSVVVHLNVPDVDAAWNRAVKAGAEITMPLADQFWGDRYGMLRDPFGHEWSMATHKQDLSQTEIDRGAREAFAQAPATGSKWPATRGGKGTKRKATAGSSTRPAARGAAKGAARPGSGAGGGSKARTTPGRKAGGGSSSRGRR